MERRARRSRELEDAIARAEARQKELRRLLADSGRDWEELDRLAREERELDSRLEGLIQEWAKVGAEG